MARKMKTEGVLPVVYVAGKYYDEGEWETFQNIRKAEIIAAKLWPKKIAPICPHKNTENFGSIATWGEFMAGSIAILNRCDALMTVDNWKNSKGAKMEVEFAQNEGIPIFHNLEDLLKWSEEFREDRKFKDEK
tara:strand:+ start:169 stop:567 length:399 start_codon:yes stop_codon:yes gene_type:complete